MCGRWSRGCWDGRSQCRNWHAAEEWRRNWPSLRRFPRHLPAHRVTAAPAAVLVPGAPGERVRFVAPTIRRPDDKIKELEDRLQKLEDELRKK